MTASVKIGQRGEKAVSDALTALTRQDSDYVLFADYTFRYAEEQYAQIDFLLLSPFGVFVIEVKNYDGIVTDSKYRSYIEQTIRGKTFRHKNPVVQNQWHTHALAKLLDCPLIPLTVFAGDAQVYLTDPPLHMSNLVPTVLSYVKPIISEQKLREAAGILERNRVTDKGILKRFYRK